MHTCPKGHQSQSGDYCDECGAPIGAASSSASTGAAATGAAPSGSAADSTTSTLAGETPSGDPCPDCATPRSGRFCEVCGHDFVLAGYQPTGGGPAQTAAGGAAQTTAAGPDPAASTGGAGATAAGPANPADPNATAVKPVVPGPRAAAGSWRLVVTADAAYHARMQAQADPDAEPIALPAFIPERRFLLDRPQNLIGRRSRSRGIEPDVDLSGPPADPAVSHAHALLVQQPDGTWSVVDLDSSNGTYLNNSADGLPANVPTTLADGDVLHLGAWTALTIRST